MEKRSLQFSPRLGKRSLEAAQYNRSYGQERAIEIWSMRQGDYSHRFFNDEEYVPRETQEQLIGTEQILAQQIETVAKYKEQEHNMQPTVILDFGGMSSLSMIRLAKHYEDMIQTGKLAVISSSLFFTPDKIPLEKINEWFKDDEEAARFFQKYHHLVHYINSDATGLKRTTIDLQTSHNDNTLKLGGNIDIIHEHFTLRHGHKNDIDLPHLAKTLSPQGCMFISTSQYSMESKDTDQDKTDLQLRIEALKVGFQNLETFGLEWVDFTPRQPTYRVYKQPTAPLFSY